MSKTVNKIMFHLNSMGKGGAERVVSLLANEFASRGKEVIVATEWFSDEEYELTSGVRRLHVGLSEKRKRPPELPNSGFVLKIFEKRC